MAIDITFVPVEDAHIEDVAKRMRQSDVVEIKAASGRTPIDALVYSLGKSTISQTALFDGKPEMIFGAGALSVLASVGGPWALGTDAIEDHYRQFLKSSLEWRGKLLAEYSELRNVVDDRNVVSKRWLTWLGFSLSEPVPLGVNGELFRVFELRRKNV